MSPERAAALYKRSMYKGAALTGLIGWSLVQPRPCSLGYELKVSPSGLSLSAWNTDGHARNGGAFPSGLPLSAWNTDGHARNGGAFPSGLTLSAWNTDGPEWRGIPFGPHVERMEHGRSCAEWRGIPFGPHVGRSCARRGGYGGYSSKRRPRARERVSLQG